MAESQASSSMVGSEQHGRIPMRTLTLWDVVAMVIGIIIGVGIFKVPGVVAANVPNETVLLLTWLLGGVISILGALCYAELATTYPDAGGDYHFLRRAFGPDLSFLYAWSRALVITSGSLAFLAFAFGDYAAAVFPIGEYSASIYAALVTVLLTLVNGRGIREGAMAQKWLTLIEVGGLLLVILAGWTITGHSNISVGAESHAVSSSGFGLSLVFVLLAYGGWSEAAYLSAELKGYRKNILRALCIGILIVTLLYVGVNAALVHGLGLAAMGSSKAVAADLLQATWGRVGGLAITAIVIVAIFTSINATMIVGARSNFALGRDWRLLSLLGHWKPVAETPSHAMAAQCALVLALILLGTLTRNGFVSMVEYTAPVFWFFLTLVGVSVFVLRRNEPGRERPFKVPFYPVTPLVFCLTSGYLLYSSLAYTGIGALVGVAVLAAGIPVLLLGRYVQHKDRPA